MLKASVKTKVSQSFAILMLLGMVGLFVQLAYAIAAFSPQGQPVAYVGQETVTNGTLTSGTETLFRTEYEKEFWSGNLYAYPISATGIIDTAAEKWSGGAIVHISYTGRLIGTMKDDGTKVPFLSANLSTTQQSALATTVNGVSYTSTQIANFLRGDHTNEGTTTLRQRLTRQGTASVPTVLGDIIHAKPAYLSDVTYPTIFVGANDGMLHAINASDGTERWAYVPSMLISKMKTLAANPYTHDYFVDGQVAMGNATTSGTRILVGALGAGGKGLYALNIDGTAGLTATSDQDVANKILWEITPTKVNYATPLNNDGSSNATAFSNLGYTYSAPLIKKINNNGTPLQVIIVGNGYNNGGDYQAYLYVINAQNGRLVKAIKADSTATNTTGTASSDGSVTSPNGLMNLLAFDTNADGNSDRVYAGDLNGTMWKFDLSNVNPASWSASVLHVTGQPITATPAALAHPSGVGYMVNFATGGIFSGVHPADAGTGATGDLADTSTYYVYGIWDGAPASNTTLTQSVLTERCYNTAGNPSALPCSSSETRVRRVTSVPPNWATGGNKGWRVALPIAGERVVGEGSFISSGRYYFTTYNPTISYLVPNTTTYVWGENWQMALESVTGGSTEPFMDLDGSGDIAVNDRIQYTTNDSAVIAGTSTAGSPILSPNVDGIEVGKWVARGVQSQPTLVKLSALFTTLFNTNPDVSFPPATPVGAGVSGGHFDEDIYFGGVSASAQATATITVSALADTSPATLGGIEIDGVSVVPPLSTSDISNGAATTTNAAVIKNKFSGGGYTATVSGNTVTVTAPAGASYNGKVLTVLAGTSSGTSGTSGTYPTGFITFGGTKTSSSKAKINKDINGNSDTVLVGSVVAYGGSSISINKSSTPRQVAAAVVSAIATSGTIKAYVGGDSVTPACAAKSDTVVCLVDTSTFTNGKTITLGTRSNFGTVSVSLSPTTGGAAGAAGTGWRDLAPALAVTTFSGGADGGTTGDACTTGCQKVTHVHQYDDKYDVTGVNMLNASTASFNLDLAIPSTAQAFKVIVHNQYLNPAVKLHIGNSSYLPNVDYGYVSIKNYTTSATLDLATMPTYNRNPSAAGDGISSPKYIGSLAINMPIDALTAKNWWGNGDVRVGLIPMSPSCANKAAGGNDGNMYKPVRAPANDPTLGYPLDGNGSSGWSGSTTPATATGVRHGGALTIQIIRSNTPNSAIELNDHLGRSEYGWRVKSAFYSTYVLAEYNTYWHHPNGLCFYSSGWTKTPGVDNGSSSPNTPAAGSTDPKLGNLSGAGGTVTAVSTSGNTTTITYVDGSKDITLRIVNADGTVTIVTVHVPAGASAAISADGAQITVTHANGSSETITPTAGVTTTLSDGTTIASSTIANSSGSSGTGGLLNQNAVGYRRISWKELIRE